MKKVGLRVSTILSIICIGVILFVGSFCFLCYYFSPRVKPTFADFDQKNDYTISVTWKEVVGAEKYDIEYCYGDPFSETATINKATTGDCKFILQRQKGTLFCRVRSVRNGVAGQYSDWTLKEIEPWVLSAPIVTIDPVTLKASWSTVEYRYYNIDSNEVPAYVYFYTWEENGEVVDRKGNKTISNSVSFSSIVLTYEKYRNYFMGYDDEWPGNVTLHVEVAALNYSNFGMFGGNNEAEKALNTVYKDTGDFGTASIMITKDIFDALSN